jgi:hypothetical protein
LNDERRHCWGSHGNAVVTEERSGEYAHGHDDQGHTWTEMAAGRPGLLWPTP